MTLDIQRFRPSLFARTTMVLGCILSLGACDAAMPQPMDAEPGSDAAMDAGLDTGVTDALEDAGIDANSPVDSGPADTDGDGVPDAVDCAPEDESTGAEAERDCTNMCGVGAETCRDGEWTTCSAPTDCLCDTPGEARVVQCGNCGQMSERCADGAWMPTSECLDEGPCAPADVESMDRGNCGVNQRICQTDCNWGDWAVVTPRGECSPGSRQCDPPTGTDRLCNSMCMWEDDPACAVNP